MEAAYALLGRFRLRQDDPVEHYLGAVASDQVMAASCSTA